MILIPFEVVLNVQCLQVFESTIEAAGSIHCVFCFVIGIARSLGKSVFYSFELFSHLKLMQLIVIRCAIVLSSVLCSYDIKSNSEYHIW